jgi:hypothetical protein
MDFYRDSPAAIARRFQRPSMVEIAREVARDHGLTLADLKVRDRRPATVAARFAAIGALVAAGYGHSQIGRVLGRTPRAVRYALLRFGGESYVQARGRHE